MIATSWIVLRCAHCRAVYRQRPEGTLAAINAERRCNRCDRQQFEDATRYKYTAENYETRQMIVAGAILGVLNAVNSGLGHALGLFGLLGCIGLTGLRWGLLARSAQAAVDGVILAAIFTSLAMVLVGGAVHEVARYLCP